ncbi:hypothetical protein Tco_1347754 [Tanacetum coccineum]
MAEQDWNKVERTQDLVEYVYDKYVNVSVTNEMLNDLYNFAMMKEKYLSMVESEKKAKLMVESEKGKAKLMVFDEMVEYVLAKYGKNWNLEDEMADVIPGDLRIKYRKERLEGDLARAIKTKQIEHDKGKAKQAEHDLDNVDLVDALDLVNRIKKLEEDFSRLLKVKKAKEAKEADKAKLKVNKEVVEVSSDEGFSDGKDVVCFNDVKYPLIDAKIRMFKERSTTSRDPITSTSIRSIALIASTSNTQAASTSAPVQENSYDKICDWFKSS